MSSPEPSALAAATAGPDTIVPDSCIPHGRLPPLRWRDMPLPVPLRKMLGPSIILAGLALGSGEFIIWPHITYKTGFVFFWACVLAVATQYFMNMEITRWALVTGESATTGFCRLSHWWGPPLLVANIVPWLVPAWSVGAAELSSWLVWGTGEAARGEGQHVTALAIASLFGCGIVLTAGPVIYETIEKVQLVLVSAILVLVAVLACLMVRGDAVQALVQGCLSPGVIPDPQILPYELLLGALAFAGAGGTLNLGQSNYVKEKGYGMGHYIGRITSPLTGRDEAAMEIGYHFPHTEENLRRWRVWWHRAGWEHFLSFFLTCLVCLALLTLIAYSVFFDAEGNHVAGSADLKHDLTFILGQAGAIEEQLGGTLRTLFLVMGVAILLTTEFGVLDSASRISTDLVKVNWLSKSRFWTESRLYLAFLWGSILVGAALLAALGSKEVDSGGGRALGLFKFTSAVNGGVMFVYCGMLLYLNRIRLPAAVRMSSWRAAILVWGVLFFGFFTVLALYARLK